MQHPMHPMQAVAAELRAIPDAPLEQRVEPQALQDRAPIDLAAAASPLGLVHRGLAPKVQSAQSALGRTARNAVQVAPDLGQPQKDSDERRMHAPCLETIPRAPQNLPSPKRNGNAVKATFDKGLTARYICLGDTRQRAVAIRRGGQRALDVSAPNPARAGRQQR